MRDFLLNYGPTLIILLAFAVYVIVLAINHKWQQLRTTAYKLMLQAESVITGTKRGQERFEVVFAQLYSLIPAWLRFFFPETLVRQKLQEWYDTVKDYFDNGKIDGSTKLPDSPAT